MVGTQTCSRVPMNPVYTKVLAHTVQYTQRRNFKSAIWWRKSSFSGAGYPHLGPRCPASNGRRGPAVHPTHFVGEPPSTHPIAGPRTLRCTSDPSGIRQRFFLEVCRDFDGLRRRVQNVHFEGSPCFLVGFTDWGGLGCRFSIVVSPSLQ